MSLLNEMLHDLANQKPSQQIAPTLKPVLLKTSNKLIKKWVLFGFVCVFFIFVGFVFSKKLSQFSAKKQKLQVSTASVQKTKTQIIKKVRVEPAQISYVEPLASAASQRTVLTDSNQGALENQLASSINKVYTPQTTKEWHDALLDKSLKAINQGFDEKAIKILQEIVAKIPNASTARENLASLYLSDGDYVHAEEVLNEGLAYAPVDPTFLAMKARLFLDQNAATKAIKLLSHHHPAISKYPDYYATLAAAYQSNGQILEAGALYRSLLQLDPNNGQYWLGYAIFLEHNNKLNQAIEAYVRASKDQETEISVRDYAENRLKILQG